MQLRRLRIIVTGMAAAVVGAAIPIAVMGWLSWQMAQERQVTVLDAITRRVLNRAELTFAEAYYAMDLVQKERLTPCSLEHIARMRVVTVNILSVEEIGYFENGFLKCTSWGLAPAGILKGKPDYVGRDGLGISFQVNPAVSLGETMIALQMGSYNVLVSPMRFVDAFIDNGIAIALMSESGDVIKTRNDPDLGLAAALFRNGIDHGLHSGRLYTVLKRNGRAVVAMVSEAAVRDEWLRQMRIFIPFGAFMALCIVGIVFWMSKKRLLPKAELELAVRNREFIVYYQPIIELKTGICFGAEALVRWKRPDGTMIRPDLFIPIAEETGTILAITDQVIDCVIADLGTLLLKDRALHIAINVCADDMGTGRILRVLDEKLSSTAIRREQIWLEVTERGLVDIDAARATLLDARDLGHAVAIDDFGTGYSSLQYLQGLPMDALKIDKSFVDTIGRDTATSSVILHIISMSQELGLITTAEGVETEEQAAFLRLKNVDFAQGWLFSKAISAQDFIEFYEDRKARYGPARGIVRSGSVSR
ncbi:hypothetical protein ASG42_26840 [Rhizobium sp. Leaf391]|uniref:EAL domain-containing protein n=1 Tax=Rhizobium sp. Leaf391 TaxID=1736360 RepID=UPI000713CF3E|nr:EAL domain-containing protein [Rhizobium sp. Leaf391]KQT01631.1 hypothetical protein ASG42_26840 [Rhizobium sp. Leaf391]